MVGGFEPDAKPWVSPEDIPQPFEFQLLAEDWEHFAPLMEQAQRRIPALREAGIKKFYNGPESFTPDNQFILGPAPGLAELLGRRGVQLGRHRVRGRGRPGAGPVDRGRRPGPGPDRGRHPPVRPVPRQHPLAARPGRRGARAALRGALAEPGTGLRAAAADLPGAPPAGRRGAVFGSKMGWERPNVFAPPGAEPVLEYSWDAPNWLPWSAAEQRAARRDVAALRPDLVLQVSAGRAGRRAGAAVAVHRRRGRPARPGGVHGPAQRRRRLRGRPDRDPALGRTSSCWSAAPPRPSGTKIILPNACPVGTGARLVDVTSAYAVFGVMGPRSRELLAALSRADFSDAGFPFGASRAGGPGLLHRPGHPDHLRGRAGLGAVRAGRVRGRRVRPADRGRRRVRPGQRRLLRDRVDAAGEGLPGLRPGADPGVQPGRGGPAVRLQAGHAGPVPGPGGGGEGPGRRAPAAAGVGAGRPGRWAGGLRHGRCCGAANCCSATGCRPAS